jgi:succinoglycan biosynthesis transport protein ExoP
MATHGPQNSNDTVMGLSRELRGIWCLIVEKLPWLAVILVLCGLAGAGYLYRTPKIYRATTTVAVEADVQRSVGVPRERSSAQELPVETLLKTFEQSLQSPSLYVRVARVKELANDPAFLTEIARPASDARLREKLSAKLTIRSRPGTALIDVTAEDTNPLIAQKLATTLVREFMHDYQDTRGRLSRDAHEFLKAEAERLKAALSRSERALQDYKQQHQAVSLEERQNIVVARLQELNASVTTAKTARLKLESEFAQVQQHAGTEPRGLLSVAGIASLPEVSGFRAKLAEKENEIAGLQSRYRDRHPRFVEALRERDDLRDALDSVLVKATEGLTSSLDALRTTERNLEQALSEQEELALKLSETAIPYGELAREVAADRALYEAFLARLKETDALQGGPRHLLHVVAPALLPDRPAAPNKRAVMLVSLFCGGFLCAAFLVVAHLVDGSFKSVAQAEKALGLRSIGAIPLGTRLPLDAARNLLRDHPLSPPAESFRGLRTAMALGGGGAPRSLVFTSALPGEGKSFCAVNYAVALAQQGLRTLLVDADLRRPSIGRIYFEGRSVPGLSDVLGVGRPVHEAVRPSDTSNLWILTAGTCALNASAVLKASAVADFLNALHGEFDRIVIDTAPIHAASESLLFSSQADAVCLVVRAGKTSATAVISAQGQLGQAGARLVGFVLNGVRAPRDAYYSQSGAAAFQGEEVYGASSQPSL